MFPIVRAHASEAGPDPDNDNAIALVGLSCRLPGCDSPAAFWGLLRQGESAITRTPAGRLPAAGGIVRHGGFLDTVDEFDPAFFGITPHEASMMDPQQRLMLELSWSAIEDAGIVADRLDRAKFGVFIGAIADDYAALLHRRGQDVVTQYSLTGLSRGIIANRISYFLDLHGPSMTVDTAQSSSLVAVHLACQSLRRSESSVAIVGGVNLILADEAAFATAKFGALSPGDRVFAFDKRADGYVRGEGGIVVILKPLAQAVADRDRIYSVIHGSALNSDGATDGLTVPSSAAQQDVLRLAYRDARIDPGEVQYVELHGTGTRRGDPVEADALGAVLGKAERRQEPLRVASAKTNVGHLEGAAGIVGLLKAALSVWHGELPPSLNFSAPNPGIPLADLNLHVQQSLTAWPKPDERRIAGVSSFGMGGTNCHVVLAEAPPVRPVELVTSGPASQESVITLSATTPQALQDQAGQLAAYLRDRPDTDLNVLASTLANRRTHFPYRAAITVTNSAQLIQALNALTEAQPHPNLTQGHATSGKLAFLLTGQGAQHTHMGRQLYETHPTFAHHWDQAAHHLELPPIHEDLPLDQTRWAQPALFALQVALFSQLEEWGIHPDYLIGHSLGEITAAHIAGILTLPDAATLITTRAQLMQTLPTTGAMIAIHAPHEQVQPYLTGHEHQAAIAAINTPNHTVISGDHNTVHDIAQHFPKTTTLTTNQAFHSPHTNSLLHPFHTTATTLTYHPPTIPIISTTTNATTPDQLQNPSHWTQHLRTTVHYQQAILRAHTNNTTHYLELGPNTTLTTLTKNILHKLNPTNNNDTTEPRPTVTNTLHPKHPETHTLTNTLTTLHTHHNPTPNWNTIHPTTTPPPPNLPTYPFQHNHYWLDTTPQPTPDNQYFWDLVSKGDAAELAGALGVDADTPLSALLPALANWARETITIPNGNGTTKPAAHNAESAPAVRDRLAGVSRDDQVGVLFELVRSHAAEVLGHAMAGSVEPSREFLDIGFDSLSATDFRRRLQSATGVSLPETLVFDFPTPTRLAEYLRDQLAGAGLDSSSTSS